MAKDSLFRVPLLGPLITHLGAFPIHRGSADRESMAHSEAVLRQGHALVLFPEGTRKEGLGVAPLHDGAMFVAARTGEVAALQSGEDWKRYLEFSVRLHSYSPNNIMLLAAQYARLQAEGLVDHGQLTYIAGFHTWKALGRSVS